MKYTVYQNKDYLTVVAKNISKEDLSTYGKVIAEIKTAYDSATAEHRGYKLKRGLHQFYALLELPRDKK